MDKYPGFDEFVERVGMDVLESMSLVEALQIAFLGGRNYEARRDIEALNKIIRTQAE